MAEEELEDKEEKLEEIEDRKWDLTKKELDKIWD